MLDLTAVRTRYYLVKFRGQVLELEPPKLKTLNEIVRASNGADYAAITPLVARVLSKNRRGHIISPEMVEDTLTIDQVVALMRGFVHWLNEEKRDPN